MSRLRLLLTTDAVGGVWTYSLDLAAELARQADTILFLAVLGPAPNSEQLTSAAAVPGLQLIETGLPLDWTAGSAADMHETAAALAELSRRAEVDLVQLHAPALACADHLAPVVSVVHSCVATWWEAVKGGELPDDLAWRTALTREGLRHSDMIVTPTRSFAEAVQRTYGLKEQPCAVHNGRAEHVVAAADSEPFAFTAGRLWDAGKNIAAFDRAAALSAVPFRAAGPTDGPNGASVALHRAEALGLLSEADLHEQLGRRPIFVSAARYEPFGLSVLEAAQAGCALVLSSNSTFRELWHGAALFADTPEEIASCVDRLAADPQERARYGAAARRRTDRFTTAAMGSAMLSHYRLLLRSERKAAA